ncbi:MAG: hypothetical protein JNK60_10870 [Acidobacteria bacterium]|nr:hypothetical protein [Acidobacteriota bacterium]
MNRAPFAAVVVALALVSPVAAQEARTIQGAAILDHPAGKLAVQTAELFHAGKIDEGIKLRTKAEQADWKKAPAGDRAEMSARMKQRAPEPKAFADAIRKGGVLKVRADGADLMVPMEKGATAIAYFDVEGGVFRGTSGPIVVPGQEEPVNEKRIQGAEILEHPIGDLALRYADSLQTGRMEDAMKLASTKAQADWKALPASEKMESAAFIRKMVPKRAVLEAGIRSGGLLIIEDDARATLNVITTEQKSTQPGVVSGSSTTTAIPFVMEAGAWKLAR